MEYLIKVEVVGDHDLRAIGFMDDNGTVMLQGCSNSMTEEEVAEGAKLIKIAGEQLDILRDDDMNLGYMSQFNSIEV